MVAAAFYPDPQKLYEPDPEVKDSVMVTYGAPFGGFTLGLAVQAFINYSRRRPLSASILLYIPWSVGTALAFEGLHRVAYKYYARRDTIHKHYVQLHPEDFPPPPKVKIGELFEDWQPVR